mgnify:CR=1 FL=1
MMKILFGYKTAHTQYVVSFSYPQFPKILRTVRIIGTRHTIINQMNLLGSTYFRLIRLRITSLMTITSSANRHPIRSPHFKTILAIIPICHDHSPAHGG